MKKTVILTMILSILMVALCLNSYAQDLSSEITTLEQKAERIQSQINQAKQQSDLGLDQQAKAIAGSIDSLVKQRVQLDAHIARLESQMEDIKKSAQTNLSRQIKQYNEELGSVKQQLTSLVVKQSNQGTQKATEPAKPAAPASSAAPVVPATPGPAAAAPVAGK
jgi:chromosome segregation ATPase